MQCDAMRAWPKGAGGLGVGTDRCICVRVYIAIATVLRGPEGLGAHRAGIGFYTHTYDTSDKDVTRLDDEEGRQRGNNVALLIWGLRVQSGRGLMQVKALK